MKKVFITLLASLALTSAYANTAAPVENNTKNLKASNDYQYVGLQGDTITAIYVDPTTGSILAAGPNENAVLSLYYSKDGQSFNSFDLSQFSNLGTNVYALAALIDSTTGTPIIFIGTDKGLFAAVINGSTLSVKNVGNITFQVNAITVINTKTMAVATAHGLYVSTDGGKSFYQNTSLGGSGSPAIGGLTQSTANVYVAYSGLDGMQPAIVVATAPKASFVSNNPKFIDKAYIDIPPSASNRAVSIYADSAKNVVDVVMNYSGLQSYQEVHQCTVPTASSSYGTCQKLNTLSASGSSPLQAISCAGLPNASTTYCAADQGLFVSSDDSDDFTNTTEGQYSFYTDFGSTFYPQSIFSNGKNVYANLIDVNSNVSAGIYKIA